MFTPASPGGIEVEEASEHAAEDVVACQAALGEALWAAYRTRPDAIFTVSRLAQLITKNPARVKVYALHLVGYLVTTQSLCLRYKAEHARQGEPGATTTVDSKGVIEAMTDSSFAPGRERSQEAVYVYTEGSLTGWITARQPFTAASTAEAELLSTMSGFCFGRAQTYILWEFLGTEPQLTVVNDNMASIAIVNGDSNNWRSRHLRIRAHVLREQVRAGALTVVHIEGAKNVSDAGTKSLPLPRLSLLRTGMGLLEGPRQEVEAPKVKALMEVSANQIRAAVLAAAIAAADAQEPEPISGHAGTWELCVLLFLVVCTTICMWEAVKGCGRLFGRVLERRGAESRVTVEPDGEQSPSERSEPDAEDEHVERSEREGVVVRDPGDQDDHDARRGIWAADEGDETQQLGEVIAQFQYVDDVAVLARRVEREEGEREQGLRRRQGQRVYVEEPDGEPQVQNHAVGVPPWPMGGVHNENGPQGIPIEVAHAIHREAEALFRVGAARLVDLDQYPFWLRDDWPPAPNQPTVEFLQQHQSAWGGLESAIHQLPPNEYYRRDEWSTPGNRPGVLIRWHCQPRIRMFSPRGTRTPIELGRLSGARRTLAVYRDGTQEIIDDDWTEGRDGRTFLRMQFQGRTELFYR